MIPSFNKCIDLDKILADLYLDWFNNFLTAERFAEYYRLDVEDAAMLISAGYQKHEERVQNEKSKVCN